MSSGPVMSEYMMSSGFADCVPLLVFGTGLLVCLPTMQCSQVAGMVKRLAGIPWACPPWAIQIMDVRLMCPRCLCQVWRDGATWVILTHSVIDAVPLSWYRLFPSLSPSARALSLCWTDHVLESKIVVHPSSPSHPTETSRSEVLGHNVISIHILRFPELMFHTWTWMQPHDPIHCHTACIVFRITEALHLQPYLLL